MGKLAKIIRKYLEDIFALMALSAVKKITDIEFIEKRNKKYEQAEQEILAEIERCNFPYDVYSPPKFETKKEEKAFQRGYMIHWQITKRSIDELRDEK